MTDAFTAAFSITISAEGGYTADPRDKGNWTGGAVNKGELRGTKYGISASSYPIIDIANLTIEGAEAIYRRDYWGKIGGDALPVELAVVTFDAAVNSGVETATRWLQTAVGAKADGKIGPVTLAAAHTTPLAQAVAACLAVRAHAMPAMAGWPVYGMGWIRRIVQLALAVEALSRTVTPQPQESAA